MQEFVLSSTDGRDNLALHHGHQLVAELAMPDPQQPIVLGGSSNPDLAAVAAWAVADGRSIVLEPASVTTTIVGARLTAAGGTPTAAIEPTVTPVPWQVGMYSSGSTRSARGYGFTLHQLDQLASWYQRAYRVTRHSVIVTQLPVAYNFAFVAGVYLAGDLGAHLHLSKSPADVFADASRLAPRHDRCVILANPVLLSTPPSQPLPANVVIDSGGAPLSTWAILHYRLNVGDLREGYGLTETGSLTHFDAEATDASLGSVGNAMPGVHSQIVEIDGKPRVRLTTPALGTPIEGAHGPRDAICTEDVGRIDNAGRLRLLGRADDYCVNGQWPRDSLDVIGPILGPGTALVRHPTPDSVHVRLLTTPTPQVERAIRTTLTHHLSIGDSGVTVDHSDTALLHSHKIPRPTTALTKGAP